MEMKQQQFLKTCLKRLLPLFIILTLLLSIPSTNIFAETQTEMGKYHSLKDTSSEAVKTIEYGKKLCLGIQKLHEEGYTGKGVIVAYIDQPALTTHDQFSALKLHYSKVREAAPGMQGNNASFHGTTVLSILAGNTIGVAPESEVYYVAHPSWQMDMSSNAEALRKLIAINKTLPADKKISVAGYSDTAGQANKKNNNDFFKAIKEAEDSGMMVLTCNYPLNMTWAKVTYPANKDDSKNYEIQASGANLPNTLAVPNNGITTAAQQGSNDYTYWEDDGGSSWQTPYLEGLIALGLQVDYTLTEDKIAKYLMDSATVGNNGIKLINPEGFIDMVKENTKALSPNAPKKPYYYVLYNSRNADDKDLAAYLIKIPEKKKEYLFLTNKP